MSKIECDYKAYAKAYEKAVDKITNFVKKFEENNEPDYEIRNKLYDMYINHNLDPDSEFYRIHSKGDIKCFADGLVSIRRLCNTYPSVNMIADEYAECRRTPIFFFPSENGGINTSRANKYIFNDRIDYTLYDIKNYCMGMKEKDEDKATKIINSCKLKKAYEKSKTKIWFESFGYDFEKIIDWYGVKGIFVNGKCEVYDLERSGSAIIQEYKKSCKEYAWECNDNDSYYINLKAKIKEFEEKYHKTEETNP
jgi:hypothetical protein